MLVFIAAATSCSSPGLDRAANLLGIGRGADLAVLPGPVFIGYVATTYRRFLQIESQITDLARELALLTVSSPENKSAMVPAV